MELNVSDIKQWFYCQRVVYWTRVAALARPVTAKMNFGKETHDALDLLEQRRTFGRYGLTHAARRFHLYLHSENLGLTGILDLCLETEQAVAPVEFKDTLGTMQPNHQAQLSAYALLLEEAAGRPCDRGFWVSIPRDRVRSVALTRIWKNRVREALDDIRHCIEHEAFPDPPARYGPCVDCEFLRFCGDRDCQRKGR